MLTVNVYIIVIYDVITVDYCKCILLYSPLNSYLYVHWILKYYYYYLFGKLLRGWLLTNPITSTFSGRRCRSCVISHVCVGRVGILSYNSLDGVQSVSSIVYQYIYVQFTRVQFLDSILSLISS